MRSLAPELGLYVDESWNPYAADDHGEMVQSDYGLIAVFHNNEFESLPAAYEAHGLGEWPPRVPDLI